MKARVLVLFYASCCPYCKSFFVVFGKNAKSGFNLALIVKVDDYDARVFQQSYFSTREKFAGDLTEGLD